MVSLLNKIFSSFDDISDKYGVEKIKTIGDAYMVVVAESFQIELYRGYCQHGHGDESARHQPPEFCKIPP